MTVVDNTIGLQGINIGVINFYLIILHTFVVKGDTRRQFGWHFIEGIVTIGSFNLVPS